MDVICLYGSLVSVPGLELLNTPTPGSPRLYLYPLRRGTYGWEHTVCHHVQTMWRRGQELLVVVSLPQTKASNKAGRSVQSLLLLSSSFASAIAAEGRIIQSGRPLGGNEKESFH